MEIYLLDSGYSIISVVDDILSCRVVKRFFSPGEFSFSLPASADIMEGAEYVYDPYSGFCGVIETLASDGDVISVGGRSLEALLERRIIYGGGRYSGNVESAIRTAVEQNAIKKRPIASLALGSAAGLTATAYLETSWSDLSDWVYSSLKGLDASYSVKLDPVTGALTFRVEKSRDRTRASRYPVIFSERLGNVEHLKISTDVTDKKNVAYVRGSDGTCVTAGEADLAGAERRETFVSASDIAQGSYGSYDEYVAALEKRGEEKLASLRGKHVASCSVPRGAEYGKDYVLGDVCEIEAESGLSFSAMVTSVTYDYSGGEAEIYPAFGEDEKDLGELIREALERRAD